MNLPEAQHANRTGSLRMLGYFADSDLAIPCARAAVFSYISPYESFEVRAVEATAKGNAVLASSPTAVGKLAKGAAVLIDPLNIDDIPVKLECLLEDKVVNRNMQTNSIQKTSHYTRAKTTDQLGESSGKVLHQGLSR